MPEEKKDQDIVVNKKDELSDNQLDLASGGLRVPQHERRAEKERPEIQRPDVQRSR